MIGETKDAGFQIGVSKTVDHPAPRVWDLLTSPPGLALWLGEDVRLSPEKGSRYETADGTVGEIRSYHDGRRIRLTWRPRDWDHDTTLQLTVTEEGDRAAVRFHQESLAGPAERERQRDHWKSVVADVITALES